MNTTVSIVSKLFSAEIQSCDTLCELSFVRNLFLFMPLVQHELFYYSQFEV